MKRHPELSVKKAEYLGKARALVNQPKIEKWFEETRELLGNEICVLEDPSRVWNMDESAFFLILKDQYSLQKKEKTSTKLQ